MKKSIVLILSASALFLAGCKTAHHTHDTRASWNELTASHLATPLDLTTNYTTPVSYFNKITRFPAWRTVPRGHHVFHGVLVDIEGMICLWGESNAVKLHIVFPEERRGIAVNQTFETLYVYHGSFFKSPAGTPVCAVVLRYADGTSLTNRMLYGEDVINWVANTNPPTIGPTGSRSTLAWVGGTMTPHKNRPVRLCLTAIENPQPLVKVEAIDLYSCKSATAPCIMAMTLGKSGLLK